jgi:hypothetical protein
MREKLECDEARERSGRGQRYKKNTRERPAGGQREVKRNLADVETRQWVANWKIGRTSSGGGQKGVRMRSEKARESQRI